MRTRDLPAQYVLMGPSQKDELTPVAPMMATPGAVPTTDGWAFEFKWDGVRAVVAIDSSGARAMSRNKLDITRSYPELQRLGELLDDPVIVDGELVALDDHGRPSIQLLARRMHVRNPTPALLRRIPVQFYVFDLLHHRRHSLLTTSYLRRRNRLLELGLASDVVRTPPHYTDIPGPDLLIVAHENGLEGIVSKRLTSIYRPDTRSPAWIKTPLRDTQEVVIGGWIDGEGNRQGAIGALVLGVYDLTDGRLRYVGRVGSGFTQAMLRDLTTMLDEHSCPTSPFHDAVPLKDKRRAHWVRPVLVGEVEHRQWTPDNRLRHPVWRGLRPDREPDEITAVFHSPQKQRPS